MYMQRTLRTIVDQNFFTKVTFSSDNEIKITGRLLDISDYGFCMIIKQILKDPKIESEGFLDLEKMKKIITVPVTIKWIDPPTKLLRCIGFESQVNLRSSLLRDYIM